MLQLKTFFLSTLLVFLISGANTASASGCSKPLTWAWHTYLPYASHDKTSDAWGGLDIKLITSYLKAAGCSVRMIDYSSKRALKGLEKGQVDMVAAASFTEERHAYGRFSISYRPEKIVLFFRRGEAAKYKISKLSDLISHKLNISAGLGGWYGKEYGILLKQPKFKKKLHLTKDSRKRMRMLDKNRIDVVIADMFSGKSNARAEGVLGRIEMHDFVLYEDKVHLLLSRKSVPKSDVAVINNALKNMMLSAEYQLHFGLNITSE